MTQTGSPYRDDNECRDAQDSPRRKKFVEERLEAWFEVKRAETWIESQKAADEPDWSGWLEIFIHTHPQFSDEQLLPCLRQFGKLVPAEALDRFGPLVESLDPEKIEIYEGAADAPIFLAQRSSGRIFVASENDGQYVMTDRYAMFVFLRATFIRAWKDGESELAVEARKTLCARYEKVIRTAAQNLRHEYDDATILAPPDPPNEFYHVAHKFDRVIAWGKTGNKLRAVLISGDKLHPDDFIDGALVYVSHGEYTLEEILRDCVGKRRILETVIRDLPLNMCNVSTKVEHALFVSFDSLKIPLPPGKELL